MADMQPETHPSDATPKTSRDDQTEKRTSRACLTCRKRKSQCMLPSVDGVITAPCKRCKATGQECVIGSSNRGGRRVRKKNLPPTSDSLDPSNALLPSVYSQTSQDSSVHAPFPALQPTGNGPHPSDSSPTPGLFLDPALGGRDAAPADDTRKSSTGSNIAFDQLQNPSDALGILAQIASNGEPAPPYRAAQSNPVMGGDFNQLWTSYSLVRDGKLSIPKLVELLQTYKHYYHPYFPIVPSAVLDATNLLATARDEPVLLTAVLVIASRDLVDDPSIFTSCTEHMRSLVSDLSAGGPCGVSAVEALLLLAEWAPYTSRSDAGHVGRGEEDREAWMHVGIALRIGYFLGLDRYSFHVRGDDVRDPHWLRKRLAWTACYISDRQISIRLGRAFWSRGPGPMTTLRKEDFPMLAPAAPSSEDFASIFQATLELTLLFSNVHDVLYSNPGNSMRAHMSGGYIKYIDDFRTAIYGWKSVWGTLTCSPALKATLLMSYDYLRLYTNAFAFHATITRALSQTQTQGDRRASHSAPGRVFYNNVGAVGDARFIYEGLDAAKSLLSLVNTFVDPEQSLRYMPLRFYLYSIYSGVFLYRARCAGVLAADEEQSVRAMVHETVNRLERAGTGSQHPGSRYSRLLRLLWDKVERRDHRRDEAHHRATLQNPYRPGSSTVAAASAPADSMSLADDSPSAGAAEAMGDFSWTDLHAIGDFAVNGNNGGNGVNDTEWWSGFLPADSNSFLFEGLQNVESWDPGM